MNLKNKLEHRLIILEKKTINVFQGIDYLKSLIKKLKATVKSEDLKQFFIKNEMELSELTTLLKQYEAELRLILRYRELVLRQVKSLRMTFLLISELEEKIISLGAGIQAKIIYLEYSEYNK